jgi:hypothetical protein
VADIASSLWLVNFVASSDLPNRLIVLATTAPRLLFNAHPRYACHSHKRALTIEVYLANINAIIESPAPVAGHLSDAGGKS